MDNNSNYLDITEVLFSLFGVLDPLTVDRYSTVCKRWDQMSKDQELWRQFCLKRWKNLPKDSDCAKNWLIPSEGKERKRIDWKRVYIIRDLSEQISEYLREVIVATTPVHRRSAFFLSKKKIKDFFAKGWIEAKQIAQWGDQLKKILFKLILDENNDFPTDKLYKMLLCILDFHLEMELVMVKQAKVSNTNFLGFASYFMHESKFIFRGISSFSLSIVSKRLLRSARLYTESAKANEIPVVNVGDHLNGLAGIFSLLDAKHPNFNESIPDLTEFIKLVLRCIDTWPVENEFKEWISESINEAQEHFPSPTYEIDQCFSELSTRIHLIMSKDYNYLDTLLADFQTTNPIPVMALICFLAPPCRSLFLEHLDEFMDKYFKPYFKVSSEPKDLIPMFYYYQNVITQFPDELCSKYAHLFFPVIITAARVNHVKVNGYVCSTIFNFCRMISDHSALLPYMESLLDALYPLLHSANTDVREGAVSSITSLLMRTKQEFHKYQDRVMREFMELSQRSKSDQQTVFEELGRLCAALGDQSGALGTMIEKRFDELIENFKRDRPANEQALLNLVGCAAVTLNKKFAKYLTIVMPFILELATPNIIDDNNEDEDIQEIPEANPENEDDMEVEDDDNNNEDKENNNENEEIADLREDGKRTELREKALESIGFLLELPREDMLPYFHEIGTALSVNLETEQDLEILMVCITAYSEYTHLFFTKDADEEFLNGIRTFAENVTNLFSAALVNIEDYDRKNTLNIETRMVEQFTDILNILNNASKTPLFNEEFVSQVIEFFMLMYTNVAGRADDDFQAFSELANQVVTLFEVIIRNAVDKKNVLEDMADFFEEMMTTLNEPCEARWTEICLLAEMIETVGELPNQQDLIPLLSQCLWECRNIDSEMLQQSVACTFGIIFRKFANNELATKKELNDWLLSLLNEEYRVKRPYVYDNALLTLGLFVTKDNSVDRVMTFVGKFPPAKDGDRHEIPKIVMMLFNLGMQYKDEIMKNEEFRSEVVRALKATLALDNYNDILPVFYINQLLAALQQ